VKDEGLVSQGFASVRSLWVKIKRRWQASRLEHRSIFLGLVSVGLFSVAGKLSMGLKEIAVAWRFGVSAQVDAYLFIFNLVSWPVAIWFSTLSVIVIPLEARLRKDSAERLVVFRAELLGITLFVGFALVLLARLGLPWLVRQPLIGLPPGTVALALDMTPELAWLVLPGVLVGLMSTWMMSDGRYANTLLEGIPALCILAVVLVSSSIQAMVWATLVGTIAQLAVLNSSGRHGAAFGLSSPAWTAFWRAFGVMILGQALIAVTTLVDQFFAAGLGEGAISSLGYASRVLSLVNGIVSPAVARATLPVFSNSRVADTADIHQIAIRWAGIMGLLGLFVVVVGWLVAPDVVALLFQRGTFTGADTERVTTLLRYGLLQLPFFFASLVFVSLFSSRGQYKVLLVVSFIGLCLKTAVVWGFVGRLGIAALILSTAVMYGGNLLGLLVANHRLRPANRRDL
jgi:peptidoglycan biosynthesis protein MviN/MurJ (putative lipid II flippase)